LIGSGVSYLEVEHSGCEADCSPPSNANVKKARGHTSNSQYIFMAWHLINGNGFMTWYLVKQRDNFTFTFLQLFLKCLLYLLYAGTI